VKKYVVGLTDEERKQLEGLTSTGECKARKLKRAMVLLGADEGDTDRVIAQKVRLHEVTVEGIRKRFVEQGLESALNVRPRPGKARKLDGRQAAQLLALHCTQPPGGWRRWTLQLLANKLPDGRPRRRRGTLGHRRPTDERGCTRGASGTMLGDRGISSGHQAVLRHRAVPGA